METAIKATDEKLAERQGIRQAKVRLSCAVISKDMEIHCSLSCGCTGDIATVAWHSGVHWQAGETVKDQALYTWQSGGWENFRGWTADFKVSVWYICVLLQCHLLTDQNLFLWWWREWPMSSTSCNTMWSWQSIQWWRQTHLYVEMAVLLENRVHHYHAILWQWQPSSSLEKAVTFYPYTFYSDLFYSDLFHQVTFST